MGQIIDGRAYFDLSSWLPDIEGMRRIEVIREWLAMEGESFCPDCGELDSMGPCKCSTDPQFTYLTD